MKYLKTYNKLFENLESKFDLKELNDILIDFRQMGLNPNIEVGSTILIDWERANRLKKDFLKSFEIDNSLNKGRSDNSLKIEFIAFQQTGPECYNIKEVSEAYEMVKEYLFETYDLIPNYVYINFHWDYLYFENFEMVKNYKTTIPEGHNGIILGSNNENIFKAHRLIFGFYEDPDAPSRGPEF